MANARLTQTVVDGLKPKGDTPYFVWDEGKGCIRGFGIRVLPSGRRVAVLQYRLKGAGRQGMARRYTIGEIGPDLPFARARAIAEEKRASVVNGGDPARDVKAKALATIEGERLAKERTFKVLADAWLEQKKHLRTYKQQERIVNGHLKGLHKRDVAAITFADLETLIDAVRRRAPYMSRQVLIVLCAILDLGLRREWVTENIATRIEVETPVEKRDRVLTDKELKAVWNGASAIGWPAGPIAQLLILTAARREEVAGLDWSELDMKAKVWKLPAARAKNGEAHLIHISGEAVALLKTIPRGRKRSFPKKGLLFSSTGKTSFSGFSKAKNRIDEKAGFSDWRLHDLRRTVATNLSEMRYSIQVVERILNHRGLSRSGIVGIYQRSELLAERKAALEAWGKRVAEILKNKQL